MTRFFTTTLLALLLLLAGTTVVLAQTNIDPLVNCGNAGQAMCTFNDIFLTIKNVGRIFAFQIAPIALFLGLMYVGYIYLTHGTNSGQLKEAKEKLYKIIIGYFLVLGAWVLINTLVGYLVTDETVKKEIDTNLNLVKPVN